MTTPTLTSARARKLLTRFRGRRIGVVGDLMLDRYLWGTASRLSPEAAVPVVDFVEQSECLGGAGNVTANLVSLGARVSVFGVAGEDEAGAALRQCLAELGLAQNGVIADDSRPTTVKTRIIARHQQIVRVDREHRAALAKGVEERLIRRIKASLSSFDALVVSDYDKGVVTPAVSERVLESCHKNGVRVFVSPKTPLLFTARGAAAMVCNEKEAGTLVQRSLGDDEELFEQAGRALLAHFGCSAVIITRGARGMNVYEEGLAKGLHIPAISREVTYARLGLPGIEHGATGRQVFDVTGAGDTVLAALTLGVASGATLREAAMLANAAAGVVVGKLGTATATAAELLATLDETL